VADNESHNFVYKSFVFLISNLSLTNLSLNKFPQRFFNAFHCLNQLILGFAAYTDGFASPNESPPTVATTSSGDGGLVVSLKNEVWGR